MSTSEKALTREMLGPEDLVVTGPTLLLAETDGLRASCQDSELALNTGQIAVLVQTGDYKLSSGAFQSYQSGFPQGASPALGGNYTLNIADSARAAALLKRELPLCEVAGKIVTLVPGSLASADAAEGRETIFYADDYSIVCSDIEETRPSVTECEVLVIGAGPYGASAAMSCKTAGIEPYWVGEPLSFWLRNIQPTPLRSVRAATNLYTHGERGSFLNFCEDYGLERTGKIQFWEFLAYYFHMILTFDLFPRHERVTDIEQQGDRWLVRLTGWQGERKVMARNVINATGIGMHPNVPNAVKGLPGSVAGHVSNFATGALPSGKRMAIIGGGQSAFEYAVHAASANDVSLYVKDALVFRNLHQPDQAFYRFLATNCERYIRYLPVWLRNRVLNYLLEGTCEPESEAELKASGVTLREDTQIIRCRQDDNGRVVIEDSDGKKTFDYVIAATGYYYNVGDVPYLRNVLKKPSQITAGRFPNLDRNAMLRGTNPGIYFTGYSCLHAFGFKSQFINGSQLVVKHIIQDIVRRR